MITLRSIGEGVCIGVVSLAIGYATSVSLSVLTTTIVKKALAEEICASDLAKQNSAK